MKISEFKNNTIKELNTLLSEKRVEIAKMRMELKMGRLSQTHLYKNIKEDIARVITELNNRRLSK